MFGKKKDMCKCPYCGKYIDCSLFDENKSENKESDSEEDNLPILGNSNKGMSFEDWNDSNFY